MPLNEDALGQKISTGLLYTNISIAAIVGVRDSFSTETIFWRIKLNVIEKTSKVLLPRCWSARTNRMCPSTRPTSAADSPSPSIKAKISSRGSQNLSQSLNYLRLNVNSDSLNFKSSLCNTMDYLKSPHRFTFWQIFVQILADWKAVSRWDNSRKKLKVTTYQNVYLSGDFRYSGLDPRPFKYSSSCFI